MSDIKKDITDAYVCLRENNHSISSDRLDLFKQILDEYFEKQVEHTEGVVIVPLASAKFCADKTISYMNQQISDFGDNKELKEVYLNHARALSF